MSMSRANDKFRGVYSLLLTPFQEGGQIDWPVYDRYVEWQLSMNPQGLFAVCGSSEMKWLAQEERLELIRRAVRLAGTTPVVATANVQTDTVEHPDELQRVLETGVSGIVLVPPNGMGAAPGRLKTYFAELAAKSDRPVILYEWPAVEPYSIEAEDYAELTRTTPVIGIKDTTCTMAGITAKIEAALNGIVYQANTPLMLDAIERGAQGIMAIVTASGTKPVLEFWHAAVAGRPEAADLHKRILVLDSLLRFGYPAAAKYLAGLHGIPMRTMCRSGSSLTEEAKKAMDLWFESEAR